MRRILLFVVLLIAVKALATTRYVASSAGVFSGGTACNGQTAITLATWNGLTLSAGDLTWVCGTITVSGNGAVGFDFGTNTGTAGNPLTLKFDTGAVVVCATYCLGGGGGTNGGAIAMRANSYIVIDGNGKTGTIANGLNGSAGATCFLGTCNVQHSTTLISGWGCNHCTVQNLNIVDAYVNTVGNSTIADSSTVTAIVWSGGNWTISGNILHDCGWCLVNFSVNGDTNIVVSGNEIYNYAHGYALAPGTGAAVTNVFVHDNHFHDSANWGAAGCFAHIDSLHVFGNSTSSIDNFYYYNNLADGAWGTCPTGSVFVEGGGSSSPAHLNNSFWWNNVINASNGPTNLTQGWFGVFAGDTGVQQVFNNTIIGPNGTDNTACYSLSGETGHSSMSALTFGNNVASPCGNPVSFGVSGFGVTLSSVSVGGITGSDYNFYGPFGSNAFTWQSTTESTFAAWKTACSCDSHAVQNNTPLLNADGSPQAGSPVISIAKNLSGVATGNLASLQNDTTKGNTRSPFTRPGGATVWDDGAYQFSTVSAPSLSITGNAIVKGNEVQQ